MIPHRMHRANARTPTRCEADHTPVPASTAPSTTKTAQATPVATASVTPSKNRSTPVLPSRLPRATRLEPTAEHSSLQLSFTPRRSLPARRRRRHPFPRKPDPWQLPARAPMSPHDPRTARRHARRRTRHHSRRPMPDNRPCRACRAFYGIATCTCRPGHPPPALPRTLRPADRPARTQTRSPDQPLALHPASWLVREAARLHPDERSHNRAPTRPLEPLLAINPSDRSTASASTPAQKQARQSPSPTGQRTQSRARSPKRSQDRRSRKHRSACMSVSPNPTRPDDRSGRGPALRLDRSFLAKQKTLIGHRTVARRRSHWSSCAATGARILRRQRGLGRHGARLLLRGSTVEAPARSRPRSSGATTQAIARRRGDLATHRSSPQHP